MVRFSGSKQMKNTILVTGAAQGIGAAACIRLIQAGYDIVGIDIQPVDDWEILNQLNTEETTAFFAKQLDITALTACSKFIEEISKKKKIMGCVSAAGVLKIQSLLEMKEEDWEKIYQVNLKGPIFFLQTIAQLLKRQQYGTLVCISSNASRIPRMNMGAYSTSKAALTHYCKNLALEVAPYNVRCMVVSPGSTDTQMQRQLWSSHQIPSNIIQGHLANFRTGIPTGKMATPDQITAILPFLFSEQASQLTMQEIVVDGGAVLGV